MLIWNIKVLVKMKFKYVLIRIILTAALCTSILKLRKGNKHEYDCHIKAQHGFVKSYCENELFSKRWTICLLLFETNYRFWINNSNWYLSKRLISNASWVQYGFRRLNWQVHSTPHYGTACRMSFALPHCSRIIHDVRQWLFTEHAFKLCTSLPLKISPLRQAIMHSGLCIFIPVCERRVQILRNIYPDYFELGL